jgi:hypothetical protein
MCTTSDRDFNYSNTTKYRNVITWFEICNYWLIDCLLFYVPLRNISPIWRRHHSRWRAVKFRPMLGALGLWAGRDLYRATPPRFFRSHPKDRPIQSPFTTHEGMWRLVGCVLFYVPLKNFSLMVYMETSPLPVKGCKFRPMFGTQDLWAGTGLYRATPTVTQDLGFSGLIQRTAPFSRLLRHAWGCGGPILTRILTGWDVEDLF